MLRQSECQKPKAEKRVKKTNKKMPKSWKIEKFIL